MKKMSRVLTLVLALAICFSCMAMSVFAATPTCGETEHTHTWQAGCYELTCKKLVQNDSAYDENHTHDASCYSSTVTCQTTPHTHDDDCYATEEPGDEGETPAPGENVVVTGPSVPCTPVAKARAFVADVSGKYRTSMTKILATVSPVSVATAISDNQLVIDPVTNTVGNLYDSEGNLIPCTLSSDGHFIIVPTNEGYAYIPTGK